VASRNAVPLDPNAGIPDLIRRLTDDSKRLAQDEVRLAKLELREGLNDIAKGGLWLGIAFGAGVVALTAFTVFLCAGLGRLLGNYWAGTLVTAVLELGGAYLFVTRGLKQLATPSYTFEQSRDSLKETARQLRPAREPEAESDGAAAYARLRQGNGAHPVERAD
jgi:hypothetical protein